MSGWQAGFRLSTGVDVRSMWNENIGCMSLGFLSGWQAGFRLSTGVLPGVLAGVLAGWRGFFERVFGKGALLFREGRLVQWGVPSAW